MPPPVVDDVSPRTPQSPTITLPQHPPATYDPSPLRYRRTSRPVPLSSTISRGAATSRSPPLRAGLSPILTSTPTHNLTSPSVPQFAEELTPARLRRKKRHAPILPAAGADVAPMVAGPSAQGYYTNDGELYRGAVQNPLAPLPPPAIDDDAITLGSSSSSSSSASWASGLERGRRATMAVIGRVGEAIGMRRGSSASSSSDDSTIEGIRLKRRRRMSRILTRTTSHTRSDTSDKPRREHLPKKREFMLLMPPPPGHNSPPPVYQFHEDLVHEVIPKITDYPADRVVITPSLPDVIERIRNIRDASGHSADTPPRTPGANGHGGVTMGRKPRSAPGHPRKGHPTFAAPPVPRPGYGAAGGRSMNRLQALREEMPIRPKSVSDLMGMARPSGSSTVSLTSLKDSSERAPSPAPTLALPEYAKGKGKGRGCWWLDVSCPGWEDLRDIGELLSLHPLTLEDVLQQDPREKLDTFERLGYYFVVVRALDEEYFKYTPGASPTTSLTAIGAAKGTPNGSPALDPETGGLSEKREYDPERDKQTKREGRRRGWGMGRAAGKFASKTGEKVEIIEDNPGREGLEGLGVGGLNVYLVVFADGIVSFHFDDISKHTKRVLDRVLSLASDDHGSDWIAHGLLDSIVDAFFPLVRYVDGEVDEIDSLTIDPSTDPRATFPSLDSSPTSSITDDPDTYEMDEKLTLPAQTQSRKLVPSRWGRATKPSFHSPTSPSRSYWSMRPNLHLPTYLVYLRLFFLPTSSARPRKHETAGQTVYDRSTMLRRMMMTRKLVTGLSRLLGAKNQVIGKLRKRAKESGGGVEAYIGDVEDHVLLLQTSLSHYEAMLSHCQPAYLSYLKVSFSWARGGTDQAILALSTVSISILPMMLIIGAGSMNIHVPHNGDADDKHREADGSLAPFSWFAGIVVLAFLVGCGMVMLIRYWRYTARVKWAGLRGEGVPDFWNAFWGWQ